MKLDAYFSLFILGLLVSVESLSYLGSVVEHNIYFGTGTESPESLLAENLNIYEQALRVGHKHAVQVMVFPEFGYIPSIHHTHTLTHANTHNTSCIHIYTHIVKHVT